MTDTAEPWARFRAEWRPMTRADMPAVLAVAARVHPAYPEDADVFAERLHLHRAGCLVLQSRNGVAGYAIAHPWDALDPPSLNTLLGRIALKPTTFYLHDVALLQAARGTGAGSAVLDLYVRQARSLGLPSLSLVAVGGSAPFWKARGFLPVDEARLAEKLRSYDGAATFMVRPLLGVE